MTKKRVLSTNGNGQTNNGNGNGNGNGCKEQNLYVKPITLKNDNQKAAWQAMAEYDITILTGCPGTGKTFLAMAYAISCVLKKQYEFIYLTRPICESYGEKLGYLPGEVTDKIAPYFEPVYSALAKLTKFNEFTRTAIRASIKEKPLAYLRGCNFDNTLCILDEAQNCTLAQLKMYVSRLCEGSKIIMCGDPMQSDLYDSGFTDFISLVSDLPEVAIVRFNASDICRHPLVGKIMSRIEKFTKKK
jgi:phosphate starvation-inducible protein PhoH and related proteins